MTDEHLAEDAALLEAALGGGWRRDDPRLSELSARRPDWVELLHDGVGGGDLDEAALAQLREDTTEEDRREVHELIALSAESSAPPSRAGVPRPSRAAGSRPEEGGRPTWMLAAAAVLLMAAGALLWSQFGPARTPDTEPVQPLGAEGRASELSCEAPSGSVDEYGDFRWTADRQLRAGERYVVVVTAVDGADVPTEELARATLSADTWSPEPGAARTWPDRIRWTVQRFDDLGFPSGSAEAFAERR